MYKLPPAPMFGTPLADSYGATAQILTPKNYGNINGRVDMMTPPSPESQFKMFERVKQENRATSYYDALNGLQETSPLSHAFFSAQNVQILQNGLRAGVYERSGGKYVLPPQNSDALKTIMRSTFLQYGEYLQDNIREQIARLNKIVLDYAVPALYNSAVSYVKYMEDQSTLVTPMARPLNHDRNYKELEQTQKSWFSALPPVQSVDAFRRA